MNQNQPPSSPAAFPRTFYRRQLPASTCISFSSPEGRAVFASAMTFGGVYSFFPLIEQLQTQPEPAYCGLTTLVIVLNALAVDPRRSWKGPWRWYEESMLNCCVDLEEVKRTGVTFGTVACLAKCQGIDVDAVYGSNSTVDDFRRVVKQTCTAPSSVRTRPTSFLIVSYTRKAIGQTGTGHFSPIGAYDEASDHVLVLDTARFKYGPHWLPLPLMFEALLPVDLDTGKSRGYMVLGYDGSDGGVERVGENKTQLSQLPLSVIFGSKKSKDHLRREYKKYLQDANNSKKKVTLASVNEFWTKNHTDDNYVWELVEPQLQPVDAAAILTLESVRRLIKDLIQIDSRSSSIPQNASASESGISLVGQCCNSRASSISQNVPTTASGVSLVGQSCSCRASSLPQKTLTTGSTDSPVGQCCSSSPQNNERKLEISPAEILYIIYLASIPLDERRGIVYDAESEGDSAWTGTGDAAREQLLAEAALISYAIETCDFDL